MKNEMMCFIVIYHNNHIVLCGMRNDDGESSYQYAKEKGYSVRKWEMYGLNHVSELEESTRKKIRDFIKTLN